MPTTAALTDRWRRVPPLVADALLALVVALVTVISVVVHDQQDDSLKMNAWGWVLLAVQLVPLVWRRRAPVTVLLITWTGAMFYGMMRLPDPPLMFGPLLATYTVGAHANRRVSLPLAALLVVGSTIAILGGDPSDAADVAVGYFSGITAWVVGEMMRTQRERTAWMLTRRAEDAQRAATQERLAIARDLHDIVAHNVSVIAVQAEAARAVLATEPERAAQAMEEVADTARTALAELRRMLGVLRSEQELTPQPGLAAIDDLVASVRRAGMDVRLTRAGAVRPVDAVAGLTAYRVVQEALTNVLKHAGPCHTGVDVEVGTGALVVTVTDDGRGPRALNGGHGLIGMRERVAVLGGRLDAGAGPRGGFCVRAWLPLPA